jgi:hypothetical protein
MHLKPTKMVFIAAGIFGLVHLLVALFLATYKGSGHPGMLLLFIDYPVIWLIGFTKDPQVTFQHNIGLILFGGGTAFYAIVGALIGYVIQLVCNGLLTSWRRKSF